ncbi:putative threonine/Lysine efflux protein [Vibrio nigripulchritudo MADA3029]|uniref:Putative threonine/Lysine efflux protein n=1 Tax=Vibrio nigripulchritudo TaxID=28173 RepID=U4KDZ0_9VIBR|nr:LysE family transporter [Vibrio nigripulchritudo]CCN49536.1 putative threonine/Lysine efflux protein [Vibrio nigripulchritudo MADA3020]CCN51373.1 putative threonine/Lysine efflux protein [Vibrio nigripulchritudo MADA3021]CCN60008.1 putative threonine/Lysine efflux protein [Vibrio nigripulchritudo MADA3029]CCN81930.1 putative threonine/Lysine efflux protein [Vibrio nigripulchritudo BLFn1]CCN90393.1 putative threonine/Lysine efflux protein [Vibrio nigripulchritudo SFn27]
MTFSVWLSLFAICLLGAMSPGPSLVMVSKHTLAGGRVNGLAAAWAHAIGIGIYALITIVGLAVVLQQSPILFKTISYAGAAYLAYLGFNALRSKGGVAARLEAGEKVSILSSAREGFLISILSPKIALFFIALFSQFVALGNDLFNQFVIVATPLIVDGVWYTLITLLLSMPLVIDKIRQRAVLIDRISGVILIALALRVVWVV